MPVQYADVGDNWRIWADEYQSGERDARDDVAYYQADAQAPDATGQDEPVDIGLRISWTNGSSKPLALSHLGLGGCARPLSP